MSDSVSQLRVHCEKMRSRYRQKDGRPAESEMLTLVQFNCAVVAAKERGLEPNLIPLMKSASRLRRQLDSEGGVLFHLIRTLSELAMARRNMEVAKILVQDLYPVAVQFKHIITDTNISSPPYMIKQVPLPVLTS